jgi:hypothetical protein
VTGSAKIAVTAQAEIAERKVVRDLTAVTLPIT